MGLTRVGTVSSHEKMRRPRLADALQNSSRQIGAPVHDK
jgi:hypothetical protein